MTDDILLAFTLIVLGGFCYYTTASIRNLKKGVTDLRFHFALLGLLFKSPEIRTKGAIADWEIDHEHRFYIFDADQQLWIRGTDNGPVMPQSKPYITPEDNSPQKPE